MLACICILVFMLPSTLPGDVALESGEGQRSPPFECKRCQTGPGQALLGLCIKGNPMLTQHPSGPQYVLMDAHNCEAQEQGGKAATLHGHAWEDQNGLCKPICAAALACTVCHRQHQSCARPCWCCRPSPDAAMLA